MLAKERQEKILGIINSGGVPAASELAKQFNVSAETIRRDLLSMERSGFIERVHGGAVAAGRMKPYYDFEKRSGENSELKKESARRAVEFINEGDVIAVDCGTTAVFLAQAIKERFSSLTVVTHSLDVFDILCRHKNISVILCGGHFKREENAFCGVLAAETLSHIHAAKAFVFPSAVSQEWGICDYDGELMNMQKIMLKNSDEVFVVADSSKFEKKALLKLDDMKREFRYVTDSELSEKVKNLYMENDIEIFLGELK